MRMWMDGFGEKDGETRTSRMEMEGRGGIEEWPPPLHLPGCEVQCQVDSMREVRPSMSLRVDVTPYDTHPSGQECEGAQVPPAPENGPLYLGLGVSNSGGLDAAGQRAAGLRGCSGGRGQGTPRLEHCWGVSGRRYSAVRYSSSAVQTAVQLPWSVPTRYGGLGSGHVVAVHPPSIPWPALPGLVRSIPLPLSHAWHPSLSSEGFSEQSPGSIPCHGPELPIDLFSVITCPTLGRFASGA
jgi:hypothetical protein